MSACWDKTKKGRLWSRIHYLSTAEEIFYFYDIFNIFPTKNSNKHIPTFANWMLYDLSYICLNYTPILYLNPQFLSYSIKFEKQCHRISVSLATDKHIFEMQGEATFSWICKWGKWRHEDKLKPLDNHCSSHTGGFSMHLEKRSTVLVDQTVAEIVLLATIPTRSSWDTLVV